MASLMEAAGLDRMKAAKVEASSKSYGALISACGRMGDSTEETAGLICRILGKTTPSPSMQSLNALMAACEKAGQFDLAIAIFERLISQVSLRCIHPQRAMNC